MPDLLQRIGLALKCFFLVLFAGRLPGDIPERYTRRGASPPGNRPAAEAAIMPVQPPGMDRAVQLLSLLQRDGRLVDFLCEDISGYPDAQVGAAVREVHAGSRDALLKYVGLEPVITGEEGRATVVEAGFEPAAVKLVGMVAGPPPFRGVLSHRGWRASRVVLPPIGDQAAATIIAPAEVEVG
jgi:hypothetical protein